jgi:prepilin-type processing-associated H-X9-DG protein
MNQVDSPSTVYAFGEMLYVNWGQYPQYFIGCPVEYGASSISFDMHAGGGNVVFLDGHVEAVSDARMRATPTSTDDPWFHFGRP